MTTDTNLSQIVFNRLSNEKYHELKTSGQLNDQQFYITPDLDTNPGLIQDYMSNCITKIPQHINLELNNGTLTLKAGSKVYIPNGPGVFDEIIIASDRSISDKSFASGVLVIFSSILGASIRAVYMSFCTSGTSAPTDINYRAWYDITNNVVKSYSEGSYIDNMSLPIAVCTYVNNEGFTSIDQVFNGMGYIGAVAFAVPGVQAIIPNGFNSNSQLNNYTATVERVLLKDYDADSLLGSNLPLTLTSSPLLSAGDMIYVEEENQMYKASISELNKRTEVEIAKVTTDSTRITSLTPLPVYNRILNSAQVYDFGNDLLEKNITNCITKIPQNIKLELNDGVLTFKQGTKVYFADGSSKILSSDNTVYYGVAYDDLMFFIEKNGNTIYSARSIYVSSGTTEPVVDNTRRVWYDTTNKIIKMYAPNESNYTEVCFPLARGKSSGVNDTFSSIDQVFNGFGYIGNTIFTLPGVEGLIPNGRNPDGSLNNTKFTTTNLLTYTYPSTVFSVLIGVNNTNLASDKYVYNQDENYNRNSQGVIALRTMFATVFTDSTGHITSFNPKTTFQAVDSNNALWASTASKPSNKSITYSLGASGSKYTISANGWFYLIIISGKANAQATIINNTTGLQSRCLGNDETGLSLITSLPVKAGDSITVNYTATGSAELKLFLDEGAL